MSPTTYYCPTSAQKMYDWEKKTRIREAMGMNGMKKIPGHYF
jgi:hypothetical protein